MTTTVRILDQDISIACQAGQEQRIKDLAAALETRLVGFSGEGLRPLVLAALALMDEAQSTNAALVRAQWEIERLNDMIGDAGEALPPQRRSQA